MLVGYVSDDRYVALDNVLLEFEKDGESHETTSRATGAIYLEIEPGRYKITLRKDGYTPKSVDMDIPSNEPYHFRLLSDRLLGYVWPKWVQAGERSEFRVHSSKAYRLDLYRYGWEKEHIRTLGWFDEHGPSATMQITPDGDYTQTGVEWNKRGYSGNPHHTQFVTGPNRSGLYYLHAKTEENEFFSFPWIVAPSSPVAKIAVLASNINWNAYNSFGGRSNYIHPDKLPEKPTVNSRLDLDRYTKSVSSGYRHSSYAPVSFDRPEPINHIPESVIITDPIEGRSACHVCPAEWRLFGWMEKEQFSYDLYAETQLHSGVLDLSDYKILIISTHPEYWSQEMYFKTKQWVFEQGGKLMYLGGNGLNCEVSISDNLAVTHHNGMWGGAAGELAEIDKESRFDIYHESEANLLGVRCTDSGIMTGAPYKAVDTSHWIFEGTGLKNGDIFGEQNLHVRCSGGASGHETDKISPSSPKNIKLLAKGLNPEDGGAEIVHYETSSGGSVFSVGSINYPSSLPVDPNIQKITRNVLERFLAG
tara:strand:- start:8043 stop:9641 length:1599 start_codon:yes stop_codon:yes gene_type:complete